MLGAQLCLRTVTGVGPTTTNQANVDHRSISTYLHRQSSFDRSFDINLSQGRQYCRKLYMKQRHRYYCGCGSKSMLALSCKASGRRDHVEEHDEDYVEASVLISETIRHYRMRMHGFPEDMKWQSSSKLLPFSVQVQGPRADVNSLGPGFLRRFQSPTIFLKIACDGDFLLPIVVGDFSVEKLIDSLQEDDSGDCLNHFQLAGNLVGKLGYEVKMVRITERVVNTYFSRIYFHKPGVKDVLSVDAWPSDAINVARRCRAPIYVNKQIVLTDAFRLAYGMGRMHDTKSIYDVTLDSAADGPDLLAEELDLVRNMNLAVDEERYSDAAMWREKLMKIRESRHEI